MLLVKTDFCGHVGIVSSKSIGCKQGQRVKHRWECCLLTFCLTFICPANPRVPFSSCSCTGWYLPISLSTTLDAIHLSADMPFKCQPPTGPLICKPIYLQRTPGYFIPVCLDTCQGFTQLSNNSIYIPGCHYLPWLLSSLEPVDWNHNHDQHHIVNCLVSEWLRVLGDS